MSAGDVEDFQVTRCRPGYWMDETSGVLRPAVEAYLFDRVMTREQIAAMRAYLRQWIRVPAWRGPAVGALRAAIDGMQTREDIARWLDRANDCGIDPL